MGNLVFNEAALNFLLQDPDGPVGRKTERSANQIAGNYDAVVNIIWQNQDQDLRPAAEYTVGNGAEGLEAVIGFPDQGRVSQYMAEKFERESDWIVPGLMTNWDGV